MATDRLTLTALFAGPTIWAAHFLLAYVAGAIICARGADFGTLRWIVGLATLAAVAGIGWIGVAALRQWGFGEGARPPHDDDTEEDRARFLGHATVLLCGLSLVATLYVALPALIIPDCR